MVCISCDDDRPLARVYYRLPGSSLKRTKPLCLNCRHDQRRIIRRNGGQVMHTEALDRAS
jgi:hypothetical protein